MSYTSVECGCVRICNNDNRRVQPATATCRHQHHSNKADSKNSGKFSSDAERSIRRSTSGCIKGHFRTFRSGEGEEQQTAGSAQTARKSANDRDGPTYRKVEEACFIRHTARSGFRAPRPRGHGACRGENFAGTGRDGKRVCSRCARLGERRATGQASGRQAPAVQQVDTCPACEAAPNGVCLTCYGMEKAGNF